MKKPNKTGFITYFQMAAVIHYAAAIFLFSFISIIATSCHKEPKPGPEVVAMVGSRVLTSDEVSAWEVSLGNVNVSQEMRTEYIRHWVESELLYQSARNKKLTDDPWVVERLDEIERQLVVARMLEIEEAKLPQPTANQIRNYFQEHSGEYKWAQLRLVVEYWMSSEQGPLEQLRSNLLRGNNAGIWQGTAGTLEQNRVSFDGNNSTIPEIWNIISRLKPSEISRITQIQNNYWIFKLIERHEPGEPQSVDDAREEIVALLRESMRKQTRENIVRSLVAEYRKSGRLHWSNTAPVVTVSELSDTSHTEP